jgi:hypothetical protein
MQETQQRLRKVTKPLPLHARIARNVGPLLLIGLVWLAVAYIEGLPF